MLNFKHIRMCMEAPKSGHINTANAYSCSHIYTIYSRKFSKGFIFKNGQAFSKII